MSQPKWRTIYNTDSLDEARRREMEVERAPLSERRENATSFLDVMQRDPALVAERIGWLIDGNYGYGEMLVTKRVVANPRLNRRAALIQLVGIYEWMTPRDMVIRAWKKLTTGQKRDLDAAVDVVIEVAEREMKGKS